MPLSRLKRPLFGCLTAYILLLCFLRRTGFFEARLPENLARYLSTPALEAEILLDCPLTDSRKTAAFALLRRLETTPLKLRLLVRFGAPAGLKPGNVLKIYGKLRTGRSPRNPGEFDERGYLSDRGAAGVFYVSRFETIGQEPCWLGPFFDKAESLRLSIRALLENTYPPEKNAVLRGILLGDKTALDTPFASALKIAGAFHLIVPSGTNVSFVLVFFLWLARSLALPAFLHFLLPLAMAGFYGLMVGFDPPYLRAYLCAFLAVAARLRGREYDLFQALVLSAFVLLLINPRLLFHPGFQMSYLVVCALWIFRPHKIAPAHWPPWLKLAAALAAASIVAQCALLPLLAAMGGKFSLIGILANIALVPLCGLILAAGYALVGLSFLPFPAIFPAAAAITGALAGLFRAICLACAAFPGAALNLAPMPASAILGYYILPCGFFLKGRLRALVGFYGLGLILLVPIAKKALLDRDLRVVSLSLPGPGASLVRWPDGRSWLIYGSGPPTAVLNGARRLGISRLDRAIFLDAARRDNRRRLLSRLPSREILFWKSPRPFELCQNEICFRFTQDGPHVFRGKSEYSALPGRLRRKALEMSTSGRDLKVTNPK